MAEIVKAKGLITFAPNEKAPEFVLGTIAISLKQLNEWVKGEGAQYITDYKGEPQLKLQVTSMKGKRGILLAVDTWKPTPKAESPGTTTRDGITTQDDALPF